MTLKVRLAIADLSLRQQLCAILEQDPELIVLPATASTDGVTADVVLVDGDSDLAAAVELIRSFKGSQPCTRTMMLVGQPTGDKVQAALSAGAGGVVAKVQPARELLGAIRVVGRGGSYLCLSVASSSRSSAG